MPTTFGELRDQLEEALRARDDEQWCRLFDFYRRGTEPMEKDPHLAHCDGGTKMSQGATLKGGRRSASPQRRRQDRGRAREISNGEDLTISTRFPTS